MTPAESQPPALGSTVKHGDTLVKRGIKELGARVLDGRSTLAIELKEERRELIQALGGPSEISPQEMAIIEMIAQKRIRRKIAAQWALLNPDKLFDRRKRSLAPIALQLEQLEESEVRLLKELGLKKRARPLPSLTDYLHAKGTQPVTETHTDGIAKATADNNQQSQGGSPCQQQ